MKVSIIIPVYNEKNTLEPLVERILRVELPIDREIIVVDDGSADGTVDIVRNLEGRGAISACYHRQNQGKGAALRTGLQASSGDIVLVQDGDLEYDPADYPRLIRPILEERVRVVYGSRVLGRNKVSYIRYYIGGRLLSLLANVIYGIHITDEPTCYKVFDARLLRRLELECKGFEFCAEVTAKVSRLGERIIEVPISYVPRSMKAGKKIRWTDGVHAIRTMFRYRRWLPAS
ncbi:MAG: glycosyltransferase family 2 protein [Thermodesulfobacteriota bacterium]